MPEGAIVGDFLAFSKGITNIRAKFSSCLLLTLRGNLDYSTLKSLHDEQYYC